MKTSMLTYALLIVLLSITDVLKADRIPAYFAGNHRLQETPRLPRKKESRRIKPRNELFPLCSFDRDEGFLEEEFSKYREYGPVGLYRFKARHITPKERRVLLKERVVYLEKRIAEFRRNQQLRSKLMDKLEQRLLGFRMCKGKSV